jgi:hypothetical protein
MGEPFYCPLLRIPILGGRAVMLGKGGLFVWASAIGVWRAIFLGKQVGP